MATCQQATEVAGIGKTSMKPETWDRLLKPVNELDFFSSLFVNNFKAGRTQTCVCYS